MGDVARSRRSRRLFRSSPRCTSHARLPLAAALGGFCAHKYSATASDCEKIPFISSGPTHPRGRGWLSLKQWRRASSTRTRARVLLSTALTKFDQTFRISSELRLVYRGVEERSFSAT